MHHSDKNKEIILNIVDSLVEESEILPLIRSNEEVAEIIATRLFDTRFKNVEISIGFDDEHTCFLSGAANIEGFSGYGEGWFDISKIENFIEALTSRKLPLELAGGYCGKNHELEHKNFGFKISEILSNSKYSVAIALQHFPETGCRDESIMKFSSELIVGNEELDNVAQYLAEMINGNRKSFVVTGQ